MLRRIIPKKRAASQPFHVAGSPLPFTVGDFWATAFSDLLTSMTRGIVAEYLVCQVLGLADQVMNDYDSYDALTPEGKRVEVKSSAFIQRWPQQAHSKIAFDIRPRRAYDYDKFDFVGDPKRHSDIYVFACHHHKDKGTVDPIDVSQWTFYVVPTARVNEVFPRANSVSLAAVVAKLSPIKTEFSGLRDAIDSIPIVRATA
jgi:hypothetical protein